MGRPANFGGTTFHPGSSDTRTGFYIMPGTAPAPQLAEQLIGLRQFTLAQEAGVRLQDPEPPDVEQLEKRIRRTQKFGGVIMLATFDPDGGADSAFGYVRVHPGPISKVCQVRELRVAQSSHRDLTAGRNWEERTVEEDLKNIQAAEAFNTHTRPEAALALVDRARRTGNSWWLRVETVPSLMEPLAKLGLDSRKVRETKDVGNKIGAYCQAQWFYEQICSSRRGWRVAPHWTSARRPSIVAKTETIDTGITLPHTHMLRSSIHWGAVHSSAGTLSCRKLFVHKKSKQQTSGNKLSGSVHNLWQQAHVRKRAV